MTDSSFRTAAHFPGGRMTPGDWSTLAGVAAAGALLAASFPPVDLWWAAPAAIALFVVVLSPLRGPAPRARAGALLGFTAGLVFFLLLVPWVGLYVGAYAAWGLALVEALYLAAFGAGAVVILGAGLARRPRAGRRAGPGTGLGAVGAVLGVAGWWSVWEWIRSSWPWGGFPWGRLAFGQADGPLLPLASLGGTPLLGFAVASLGASIGVGAIGSGSRAESSAWKITVPTMLMIYMGGAVMSETPGYSELQPLLVGQYGWTMLTVVNLMLFSLLHNPVSYTHLTLPTSDLV